MRDLTRHFREFAIRYPEVDGRGRARPETLLAFFEEAAAGHCADAGWDIFRLQEAGLGWVLLRGGLDIRRSPRYGETVRAETWVSSNKGCSAEREYRLLDREGGVLATARALWLFLDLGRRRPRPILGDYLEAWRPGGSLAADIPLGEVAPPPEEAPGPEFAVRRSDIDSNGHVNHIVYLSWALEAMERPEGLELRSLRGRFLREVRQGATVLPRARVEGEGRVRLGVYARDGESFLAAAAESTWGPAA